jgi:hypothetical protein
LKPPKHARFVIDPVSDGAVLSLALGVGGMSDATVSTGEITPQQPQSSSRLLAIDRGVIDRRPRVGWGTISNLGIGVAAGHAIIDPVPSGVRDGVEKAIVDAFMYAETTSVTWGFTNLAKMALATACERVSRGGATPCERRAGSPGGAGLMADASSL